MRRLVIAAVLLALTALSPVETQQVLDTRQALMKEMRSVLGSLVPMIKGDKPWEPAAVAGAAQRIRDDVARLDTLFPVGTDSDKVFTMALPAIWQSRAEFQAAARAAAAAAGRLAELSGSGDPAALTAQVDAISTACTDCHQSFRVRR